MKAMCGVATERWPRTSLYRARAGAWACRWGHVREVRVSVSSTHERGWGNSGVHRLTWRAMNESEVRRGGNVGERRSGVTLASHFPSSKNKNREVWWNSCTSPRYKCSEVWHVLRGTSGIWIEWGTPKQMRWGSINICEMLDNNVWLLGYVKRERGTTRKGMKEFNKEFVVPETIEIKWARDIAIKACFLIHDEVCDIRNTKIIKRRKNSTINEDKWVLSTVVRGTKYCEVYNNFYEIRVCEVHLKTIMKHECNWHKMKRQASLLRSIHRWTK